MRYVRTDARATPICCPNCRWRGARLHRDDDGTFGICPHCATPVRRQENYRADAARARALRELRELYDAAGEKLE